MPKVVLVGERELRDLVPLDRAALDAVRGAFLALASGRVIMPPILSMAMPEVHGEVDVKTAFVPGLDGFAVKISPGFFDNPARGLPSVNGLMVVLSATTGLVEAVFLDNGWLTDVRTAAAGAVAADALARPDARIATVFGAGTQARLQMQALALVRDLDEIRVWARDSVKAAACAADIEAATGVRTRAVGEPRAAVSGADIVVTTTPSSAPILFAGWLAPGQHVTAMGSDADTKCELDPAILARADRLVVDSLAQSRRLGELRAGVAAGAIAADAAVDELGSVLAGTAPGRPGPDAVTVCDLTGTGAQDTAIAALARARADAAGAGLATDL
ncbi:cyclodeaminase [Salinarimonas ramus]|uniref:Ornithine cyclodeaminase 1 n=1 Tax=Salinarimonas ramus TaxID=690164 RepID=A0A917Q4H5_9HYPH|nr:cyclodeaminase [Salinarimonas ramus]GGK21987.1 ornithine cyclodeaminase 1 [Salinarimonas ramus]